MFAGVFGGVMKLMTGAVYDGVAGDRADGMEWFQFFSSLGFTHRKLRADSC